MSLSVGWKLYKDLCDSIYRNEDMIYIFSKKHADMYMMHDGSQSRGHSQYVTVGSVVHNYTYQTVVKNWKKDYQHPDAYEVARQPYRNHQGWGSGLPILTPDLWKKNEWPLKLVDLVSFLNIKVYETRRL
jgi:hypothetical protein